MGFITLSDVVLRISMDQGDLDEPVVAVMTAAPPTLPADAPSHRATVLMTKRYARHVVLVDRDGRVNNLLSQADLFGLRGGGAETLAETVAQAADVRTMIKAADAIRKRGSELFHAGMGAEAICHWMSALNDLVCIRVIELIEDEFDLPPIPWCWMVFGSEGRLEQTFSTDQDNGIIFLPGTEGDTQELRQRLCGVRPGGQQGTGFLRLSAVQGQHHGGEPGLVPERRRMAKGLFRLDAPARAEGRAEQHHFLRLPPSCTDARTWWTTYAPGYSRRHRTIPASCAAWRKTPSPASPPSAGWASSPTTAGGSIHDTIDLKLHGARPFVDAARIWSLAHGVWATNTADRLRGAAEGMNRQPDVTAAAVEAFHLVQRFRIQQQLTTNDPDKVNRVDPTTLNELNKLMLKEAFKQAKQLQQRLEARLQPVTPCRCRAPSETESVGRTSDRQPASHRAEVRPSRPGFGWSFSSRLICPHAPADNRM